MIGSYICSCAVGFIENNNDVGGDVDGDVTDGDVTDGGGACIDFDECSQWEHECSSDASCKNSFGSYSCKCNTGFSGDGYQCVNSEECAENSHTCDILGYVPTLFHTV